MELENSLTELIMDQIQSITFKEVFSTSIQDKLYFLRTNSTFKVGRIFSALISILSSLTLFISMFIFLLRWNWIYAILIVLFSIPGGLIQIYFNKKKFLLNLQLNQLKRKRFYILFIVTTKEYIKEIIEYQSINYLINMHFKLFRNIFIPTRSMAALQRKLNILLSLLSVGIIGFIEFQVIKLAIVGKILLGTMNSLLQSLGQVSGGVQKLIISFSGIHNDILYVDNLKEFLNDKIEEVQPDNKRIGGKVNIIGKNLTYSIGEKIVFKNLNFKFSSGSVIGIMGDNGVGKTSFLEIILGIKEQSNGQLYFNNFLSNEISGHQRVEICQMLHQRPARYEFNLEDNIKISDINNEININELESFIRELDENSFSLKMDKKTMLGEWYSNSTNLSGGQWQKLSLYRLFYKKASIYLLDEPTNNLDSESIRDLEDMIRKIGRDTLLIIVSHDFKFLYNVSDELYRINLNGLHEITKKKESV
ncbi:ABC transporter ATP-binding protein [Pullulanibacillus sp. KACC 23026]|uniref:ATP-binding cassette domain-containing protein n=1 Tax=Pullulanibacillus sp. KACC 23026 TaxID=3028315 RepID=UPI0023AF5A4F|nr:ABC transporter ATP-binding protein [Pullulanibacillus sp. KACC 23026]WEG13653.1 ABC transporter ATP-binding protein [Pullulanibacillus sp. KACC 23026]